MKRLAIVICLLVVAALAAFLLVRCRPVSEGRGGPVLTFCGGARSVGGSCLLVEGGGARFVIDVGSLDERGRGILPPHADSLDFAIITHAHLDHCGMLPELFRAGFSGPVYCSRGTKELLPVMLGMVRGISRERMAREIFDRALANLVAVPFGETVSRHGVSFRFRRVEHLLGAAAVDMRIAADGDTVRLLVSGDIGSGNSLLVPAAEPAGEADFVVMESTYGGSERGGAGRDPLEIYRSFGEAVGEALRDGGDVLIPAFTLGRTQEVLAAIDLFRREGRIPEETEVYVDSPTAKRITAIYRRLRDELSPWARGFYVGEPLEFPGLREVRSRTAMKVHGRIHRPTIFVSSSGDLSFANSPRHFMRMFDGEKNLLSIIGWQAPGSLGAGLVEGESPVLVRYSEGGLFREEWVTPRLAVRRFDCFSGHADSRSLLAWLASASGARTVFLVHGEEKAASALSASIGERFGMDVEIPARGDRYLLAKGASAIRLGPLDIPLPGSRDPGPGSGKPGVEAEEPADHAAD